MHTTRSLSEVTGTEGGFTLNRITCGVKGPVEFFIFSHASVGFDDNESTVIGSRADIFVSKLKSYIYLFVYVFSPMGNCFVCLRPVTVCYTLTLRSAELLSLHSHHQ